MRNKRFLPLAILAIALIFFAILLFKFLPLQSSSLLSNTSDKNTDLLLQLKKQDHVKGATNPKVLLIEYSDFECPFCKKFLPSLEEILQDKNLQAAVVFRHFPLPFHQNAKIEAEASECVNAEGGPEKFWQFHDLLFERTKSTGIGFSPKRLAPLAEEIGLDATKIQGCINSGKFSARVQEDIDTGLRLGISGTPTTVIVVPSGKRQTVVGSLSANNLRDVINNLLK